MIKLIVEREEGGYISFSYYFECEKGPLIVATFDSPTNVSVEKWEKLVNAVENSTSFNLTLAKSNGFTGITTKDGKTSFQQSRYGGDCGAEFTIAVDNSSCLSVLKQSLYEILQDSAAKKTKQQVETIATIMTTVIHSELPADVGAAALFSSIANVKRIEIVSHQIPKLENIISQNVSLHSFTERIVIIGGYCNTIIKELAQKLSTVKFAVYCFGKVDIMEGEPNMTFFEGTSVGPAAFVVEYACNNLELPSGSLQCFLKNNKAVIDMIDDRAFSRKTMETQIFFSGLYNMETDEPKKSLFGTYLHLFAAKFSIDEVLMIGKRIANCQFEMAQERARKNSRKGILSNGKTFAATEGPELLNLTHNALREKYPEVDVTIVVNLKFNTSGERIGYSIRSVSEGMDSFELVKKVAPVQSGGNASVAGGSTEISIAFP